MQRRLTSSRAEAKACSTFAGWSLPLVLLRAGMGPARELAAFSTGSPTQHAAAQCRRRQRCHGALLAWRARGQAALAELGHHATRHITKLLSQPVSISWRRHRVSADALAGIPRPLAGCVTSTQDDQGRVDGEVLVDTRPLVGHKVRTQKRQGACNRVLQVGTSAKCARVAHEGREQRPVGEMGNTWARNVRRSSVAYKTTNRGNTGQVLHARSHREGECGALPEAQARVANRWPLCRRMPDVVSHPGGEHVGQQGMAGDDGSSQRADKPARAVQPQHLHPGRHERRPGREHRRADPGWRETIQMDNLFRKLHTSPASSHARFSVLAA